MKSQKTKLTKHVEALKAGAEARLVITFLSKSKSSSSDEDGEKTVPVMGSQRIQVNQHSM